MIPKGKEIPLHEIPCPCKISGDSMASSWGWGGELMREGRVEFLPKHNSYNQGKVGIISPVVQPALWNCYSDFYPILFFFFSCFAHLCSHLGGERKSLKEKEPPGLGSAGMAVCKAK